MFIVADEAGCVHAKARIRVHDEFNSISLLFSRVRIDKRQLKLNVSDYIYFRVSLSLSDK